MKTCFRVGRTDTGLVFFARRYLRFRWLRPALIAAFTLSMVVAVNRESAGQDDSAVRRIAEAMTKAAAINYFKQAKYELNDSNVKGVAKAVKPEEHVKVEIKRLSVSQYDATLSADIDARHQFEGKVKVGDEWTAVKGEADLVHHVSVRAELRQEGDRFYIRPRIDQLKLDVKEVETKPADLKGAERMLKETIARHEAKFLKDINEWLEKNKIESR